MKTEILVHATPEETWVAVLEDRVLVELYVEQGKWNGSAAISQRPSKNVLPGMQAAFVDIGLERNAFLYAADASARRASRSRQDGKPMNIKQLYNRDNK